MTVRSDDCADEPAREGESRSRWKVSRSEVTSLPSCPDALSRNPGPGPFDVWLATSSTRRSVIGGIGFSLTAMELADVTASGLMAPTSKSDLQVVRRQVMRSGSVVAGGAVGTLLRWGIGQALPSTPSGFPWATLVVNVTGALALGAVGVILIERVTRAGHLRTFLGIGLLGSYTTFSTMSLEGVLLIEAQRIGTAASYWTATLIVGQMAGLIGMWLGRLRIPRLKETG